MQKTGEQQLLLAAHGMPADVCAAMKGIAADRGWRLRCDERAVPRVQSGEVVVAMGRHWLSFAWLQPPRALLLFLQPTEAAQGLTAAPAGTPYVVLSWPCNALLLLEHLLSLLTPTEIHLDAVKRAVMHRGQCVHLTPKEFRILQVLLAHAGEAVEREALEVALHAWGQEFGSNTLDVHVHRLRRKLPDAGIRAVRGYGYVLIAQR